MFLKELIMQNGPCQSYISMLLLDHYYLRRINLNSLPICLFSC